MTLVQEKRLYTNNVKTVTRTEIVKNFNQKKDADDMKKKKVQEKTNYVLCLKKRGKLYRIPVGVCFKCKQVKSCRQYKKWEAKNDQLVLPLKETGEQS